MNPFVNLSSGSKGKFTLECDFIAGGSFAERSCVNVLILEYAGTGCPYVICEKVEEGRAVVVISNVHPTESLCGSLLLQYKIS